VSSTENRKWGKRGKAPPSHALNPAMSIILHKTQKTFFWEDFALNFANKSNNESRNYIFGSSYD
jgi:hypothetical protein